ncbi:MAG: sulfotransferase, partial [Steroidobacteraceae bacterium]
YSMNETPQLSLEYLSVPVVMAAARARTELNDFGDEAFVEGLSIYLEDLRERSRLSPMGIVAQFHDVVRMLSNRLIFERDLKKYSEILLERIERPIIIFGLPRTGTSKLQRMMSADAGVQRLEMWRLLFPAPFPGAQDVTPDPRIAAAEQIEALLTASHPNVMAGHPMETREPDEEWFLLEMTFESTLSSQKNYAPKHRDWVQQRPQSRAYSYMRDLLRYLQWQDGGSRGRSWIMKSPAHIGEVETLLDTFPDATLVHCHRDPAQTIPSLAALVEGARSMYCDYVDVLEIGHEMNRYWSKQARRNLHAREKLGERQIVDVFYEDIRDHPLDVIAEIFKRAGRELTPAAKSAFETYGSKRPQNHFGQHRYDMTRYGLTIELIHDSFRPYLERFPRLMSASWK